MGKGFRGFFCFHIMETDLPQITPSNFCCSACDFNTSNKKDFTRHLATQKHKGNVLETENPKKPHELKYICDTCDKSYCNRSSLWKHNNKCSRKSSTNELVITLINQNKDLQNLLMEDRKIFMEDRKIFMEDRKCSQNTISNSNNNTNINSNNSFNLNFFLNEQCKNAINLVDFIDSLQVGVKDLERTGKVGYVEGISQIFLNGLKELDVYNRPIHCTDLKRETVYVRDQDKWEKENEEKTKLQQAVKKITVKNLKQLPNWEVENPEFSDFDSKKNDEYMAISKSSLGGYDSEEEKKYKDNIIRNVLKNTKVPSKVIE